MVNKLTIEKEWSKDPYKKYYVIINPKIDFKKNKITGIKRKIGEYVVESWDSEKVYFKITKPKKHFPEIIEFDKRYPDANAEVLAPKPSNKNVTIQKRIKELESKSEDLTESEKKERKSLYKKIKYTSYAIFNEQRIANFRLLDRLYTLSKETLGIYNHIKEKENHSAEDLDRMKALKKLFKKIDETNYFEEYELMMTQYPDIVSM